MEEKKGSGLFSGITDKFADMMATIRHAVSIASLEKIRERAVEILNYADDATDRLFHVFCIFVLTTILIPLFGFFLLCRLLRLFTQRFMQDSRQAESLLAILHEKMLLRPAN